MTSIGEKLRRQRLQNRISIEKVALETKIGVRLLEAIEAERFEKLPGGVFRKSFILQYAKALGIDSDEIEGDLQRLASFDDVPAMPTADMVQTRDQTSSIHFSLGGDGMSGSTVGSLLAAVGVIMVCALIYSWWQTPRPATAKVEIASGALPQNAAAPAPPAPVTVSDRAPAVVSNPAPAASNQAPAPATEPVAAAPPSADAAAVRVGLSADEKTWVSISSDGKNVFASSLEAHQTKIVEASEKVRLLIGNAGGLEISLNGKPIGPIGPKGQIRVVELTPAGFQIVPRKPPTVEPL
jgi:cytoskeleton protein RodZ